MQSQKHKFFSRALTHQKILEKKQRLGITWMHENLLSLQEAETILFNEFSMSRRKIMYGNFDSFSASVKNTLEPTTADVIA